MARTTRQLKEDLRKENTALKKAIKLKCLDCMCDQKIDCEIPDCSLYPFKPFKKK
jgi:hypothetical protein